ncbi:MAG: hypothetical protein HYR72_19720 [Deltaproteobacteria bacterium]|nr:hypothetical protein [Deltaproteobacteria bacterium]MBI3387333.1 hypothetical protein [Deltaproteobacteria bacterium]
MPRPVTKELVRFAAIFAALIALHWSALTLPHHWDALNRVHNAHTIAAHGFSPLLPQGMSFLDAQGRPPFVLLLLAVTVLLQPYDLIAAHVLWLAFAALAIYLTDRLGRAAWSPSENSWIGALAALWLVANPLFVAQSEIIVMEVPVTAFTLAAAVCLVERRWRLYLLTATMLVLSKEAAQLALPGFVLYAWWAAPPARRWRDSALAAAPFLAFLVWIAICKLRYGWFLDPYMSSYVRVDEAGAVTRGLLLSVIHFATLVLQIGFWDGNWTMTLIVLASFIALPRNRSGAMCAALATVLAVLAYLVYPCTLAAVGDQVAHATGVVTTGALFADVSEQLSQLRLVMGVTVGVLVLALPGIRRARWNNARAWLVLGILAGYTGFFTLLKFRMVRYLLPVYPFVFLVAAAALVSRAGARRLRVTAVTLAVVALFVSHYYGVRTGPGNIVETTLEFRDMIAVRRAAAAYLEGHPRARVLASWPETMELGYPFEGYVTQPVFVAEDALLDVDFVYVSPQSRDPDLAATLRRARPDIQLQRVFRAERGAKSVEVFRVVHRQ